MTGGVTCREAASFLREAEQDTQSLLDEFIECGLIEHVPTCGVPVYRVCLTQRKFMSLHRKATALTGLD